MIKLRDVIFFLGTVGAIVRCAIMNSPETCQCPSEIRLLCEAKIFDTKKSKFFRGLSGPSEVIQFKFRCGICNSKRHFTVELHNTGEIVSKWSKYPTSAKKSNVAFMTDMERYGIYATDVVEALKLSTQNARGHRMWKVFNARLEAMVANGPAR